MRKLGIALYAIAGIALIALGLRYLLADAPMDYHLAILVRSWSDVAEPTQQLLLGLLRGFGAGSLVVGLAVVSLALGPLRSGVGLALWLTPLLAGAYLLLLLLITRATLLPGAGPIKVTASLLAVVVAAALLSFPGRDRAK